MFTQPFTTLMHCTYIISYWYNRIIMNNNDEHKKNNNEHNEGNLE